jgi:glutaredoxin
MAIKLHRCKFQFVKIGGHPCWRVEKALIDQGIAYETVPQNREAVEAGTGQRKFPAIELEDGTWYREESKEMARRIREGRLN